MKISLHDTGTGIPEAVRSRIFEPFFTTKAVGEGTGQGLALAHNVVARRHGGKIWFDTEVGKAQRFLSGFPGGSRHGNLMAKRILFVDDEPLVLAGLERSLHGMRKDWEMVFVTSGQAALESMNGQTFDIVVTDMRMPGMDGAQLLEEVKKRSPQIAAHDSFRSIGSGDDIAIG